MLEESSTVGGAAGHWYGDKKAQKNTLAFWVFFSFFFLFNVYMQVCNPWHYDSTLKNTISYVI